MLDHRGVQAGVVAQSVKVDQYRPDRALRAPDLPEEAGSTSPGEPPGEMRLRGHVSARIFFPLSGPLVRLSQQTICLSVPAVRHEDSMSFRVAFTSFSTIALAVAALTAGAEPAEAQFGKRLKD